MVVNTIRHRNTWKYVAEDFSFKLIDEKFHDYSSLIIQGKHIRILSNTSHRSSRELRDYICDLFFHEDNERVRLHNNEIARKRRLRNKDVS